MRLKLALSAAVASLLFAAPVLAEEPAPAPANQAAPGDRAAHRHERMMRRFERMEQRMNRAVERGRLSRAQADELIAEARQLRDEALALRQSSGGKLTEEQRQQFHQRKQALREKVRAAMKANAPQAQ
ncbi:hypothetical protein JRI60_33400 [Archangium violaceum]|uniref:hypothetical protein n=1 Tax=Archangium violaceum TaxID=83451 RepID=UPI00194F901A|nr:hypothetical protein [Archangium violaceum]QRN94026.1 hypothetical protein JRI60_33400 [Archangium violaceum]